MIDWEEGAASGDYYRSNQDNYNGMHLQEDHTDSVFSVMAQVICLGDSGGDVRHPVDGLLGVV